MLKQTIQLGVKGTVLLHFALFEWRAANTHWAINKIEDRVWAIYLDLLITAKYLIPDPLLMLNFKA